ncbi:MAG: glycosyltransferase [Deltaproteobacteria bacterium]|nr:glycosyltransferase [Deltaproteobacteria bacterium]
MIAVPYLGDPVESLWWRTYPNPCSSESKLYNRFLDYKKRCGKLTSYNENPNTLLNRFAERHVKRKWQEHLFSILQKEKDVDAVFIMNIPLNHIKGIAEKIRQEFGISVAYYDGDMPTILPKYATGRGFKFNYYVDADLSEFDAFFTNSKGVIPDLEEMGARNVHPLYYAADPELFKPVDVEKDIDISFFGDPELFKPVDVEKDIDISFFGYGSEFREEWMTKMIANPSMQLPDVNFSIGGEGFGIPLGKANRIGDIAYSAFREFCCRSRICLNITRWSHTNVYASATARPFELAAYGACIVSQPYNGIEEWFEVGKDLVVVNSETEAIEAYRWLLDSAEEREIFGNRARQRILKEHTFHHRAEEIIQVLGRHAMEKQVERTKTYRETSN